MWRPVLARALFVGFVCVQGVYPLWALLAPDHVRRTDFTWDMFAVRRDCSVCQVDYVVGERPLQRVSWGLRAPRLRVIGSPIPPRRALEAPDIDRASIDALEAWEGCAQGVLCLHPERPAFNLRAPPQVARMRTSQRLVWLGGALCDTLEETFESALGGNVSLPAWAQRDARAWESSGRSLQVRATCTCAYNGAPAVDLVDSTRDLCGPRE